MIEQIAPQDAQKRLQDDGRAVLLDVRTREEFAEVHAKGAKNIPLDEISAARLKEEQIGPDQSILMICRSGARSQRACEQLVNEGYQKLANVSGGTLAWVDAQLPHE
jgi:rhodanese-related sulfurtransferase